MKANSVEDAAGWSYPTYELMKLSNPDVGGIRVRGDSGGVTQELVLERVKRKRRVSRHFEVRSGAKRN